MLPRIIATIMGALIAALGVAGMAVPAVLLEFAQSLQTPGALYVVAAIRVLFGALLVWVASASRTPRTLRVIGVVIVIGGLLTPLLGIERFQAMLDWFSSQGPLFTRAWASVAVIFGLFVVYVINSSSRPAARREL